MPRKTVLSTRFWKPEWEILYPLPCLYTIVANRLELPVRYIDIPKHPLLAYVDKRIAAKVHPAGVETDVLFYINTSNKGSISGRRELEFQLRRSGLEPFKRFFEAQFASLFPVPPTWKSPKNPMN
jgi:hypothetical protein